MALITDPDNLSQGTSSAETIAFTASAGAVTTMTGTGLPAIAAGEFFEIRDHSVAGNNGLYEETGGTPTTSSVTATKVTGINPVNSASEAVTWLGDSNTQAKNVHFDTDALEVYLLEQGGLSTDGVTKLAFHSFAKEEWKSDAFLIAAAPFPMVGISFAAGQWVWGQDPSGNNSGWKPAEDNATHSINTRRLFRNAGWDEIDSNGNTLKKYFNVTTLGTFEDSANDLAYYWFGTDATDTGAATNYQFAGPVNEPVLYFDEVTGPDTGTGFAITTSNTITRNDGGNWTTDGYQVGGQITIRNAEDVGNNGTFVLTSVSNSVDGAVTVSGTPLTNNAADTTLIAAVDNDNVFNTAIRVRDGDPNGKTFGQADLTSAGETEISSKIIKFPLANITDLDVSETDANVSTNSPYTEVRLRYLSGTYNREVDSTTKRDYGIVVDVGTYSQSNGASATSTLFSSASLNLGAGEALADYTGGSLIIHEGTDQGTHTISGTPVDNAGTLEITLTSALTATESNLSFTMERATPLTATKNEIYEKVHYQLRQDADIDETANIVTGRTADDLAVFVGPDIRFGSLSPTNPNGGGSGVIVEGFDANDTNNMFFFDNTGTSRNFPFVAAGTLNFSQTLVDDTDGEYWLFYEYTNRTTNSDIDTVTPSGDTYDLEGTLGTYAVNDYLQISGFAQEANNGLFIVEAVNVSGSDYTVRKIDGSAVGTAETNQTVNVDENPYPSPDAIIVDDNSGADIAGAVNALSAGFDFDYDNNTQGGRTAATDANVVLVAAGLETGQVAVVKGLTITRSTGLSFSVTSALERNYSNP
jgi:hypothetical protein